MGRRHRHLFAGYSRVWVWADGDEAGAKLANKITASLSTAKRVRMPSEMDVTDLYLAEGAEAIYDLMEE
ncbi:hypothetical protein [Salana multivorans]|uniref:hypothetical protein n=1 Tax=Salana multivorans TaxID=120377 RepID=UPI001B87821C|nr:hypothetical protein [Salana multivorans]